MIKKITIILLSLVLIIFPFSVLASAEENPTIYLDAPSKVNSSDENFTVQLKISNFSYLKDATIVISFNTAMVEFVDYQVGGIFENEDVRSVSYNEGEIILTIHNDTGFSVFTDGVLLNMYFVAKESAGGNCNINVAIDNAVDDGDNSLNFVQKGAVVYITPGQTFIPGEITTEPTTVVTETESSTFVDVTTTEPITEDNSDNDDNPSVLIYIVIAVVGVAVLGVGVGYYIYNSNKRKGD